MGWACCKSVRDHQSQHAAGLAARSTDTGNAQRDRIDIVLFCVGGNYDFTGTPLSLMSCWIALFITPTASNCPARAYANKEDCRRKMQLWLDQLADND